MIGLLGLRTTSSGGLHCDSVSQKDCETAAPNVAMAAAQFDDDGPSAEQRQDLGVVVRDAGEAGHENDRCAGIVTAGVEIADAHIAVGGGAELRHGWK